MPTSHVDLIPTLLGLAGIDLEQAVAGVSAHHEEVHTLPGRDLSGVVTGKVDAASVTTPVYFMTEDNPSKGLTQVNILSGAAFEPFSGASNIESVVATLPTGPDGADELWKLNHYYERLDEWNADHGIAAEPLRGPCGGAPVRVAQPEHRPRGASQPGRRRLGEPQPAAVGPGTTSATRSGDFPRTATPGLSRRAGRFQTAASSSDMVKRDRSVMPSAPDDVGPSALPVDDADARARPPRPRTEGPGPTGPPGPRW